MTTIAWQYLQWFLTTQISDHLRRKTQSMVIVREFTWGQTPNPMKVAFAWPDFPLSSAVFRSAVLALASCFQSSSNDITLKYCDRFYKHILTASDSLSSSLIEVVIGSYVIMLQAYSNCESLDELLIYFNGLSSALLQLKNDRHLSAPERRLLYTVWQASLGVLVRALRATNVPVNTISRKELKTLLSVHIILQKTSFMLFDKDWLGIFALDTGMQLEAMDCYLSFYWDLYLGLRNYPETSSLATNPLQHIILQIQSAIRAVLQALYLFVPQLPGVHQLLSHLNHWFSLQKDFSSATFTVPWQANYDDTKAAILYTWGTVLENVLENGRSRPLHSSFLLFVLSTLAFESRRTKASGFDGHTVPGLRGLFWAALTLTRNVSCSGKSQKWWYG